VDRNDALAFSLAQVEEIYDAAFARLVGPNALHATHVEPHPSLPGWIADLRHVDGTVLGAHVPFTSRQAALEAERHWLHVHLRM
jgi:hypothetical protein